MSQIARNVTDVMDGVFARKRYLIHDRDPLYTTEFLSILAAVGIQSVKLPAALAESERACGTVRPHN